MKRKQHPHPQPQIVPEDVIPVCSTPHCNKKCHNKGPNPSTGKRSYRDVCATCHAKLLSEWKIEREVLGMNKREHLQFRRKKAALARRKTENNLLSMLEG